MKNVQSGLAAAAVCLVLFSCTRALTNIWDPENPDYPGWIFEVGYELRIAGSAFGPDGLGEVSIAVVHDSPNKIGGNKVYPTPEPFTMLLLVAGAPLLLSRRRRQAGL